MYHPSRGGVRGGRDQFNWDDVKADKHRENYLGHSLKAPVGRWQKGKDLFWYTRDKKGGDSGADAAKEEIKRIKEEEERSMLEVLGLAPKRENRPLGNRLDKREAAELLKKGTNAEDLAPGYAEGERVQGLGFTRAPHHSMSEKVPPKEIQHASNGKVFERENESCSKSQRDEVPQSSIQEADSDRNDRESRHMKRKDDKKRNREEKKALKRDKRSGEPGSRRDKRRHESDVNRKEKKRRHDSDSSD
ncbi:hypothetical protein SUGI_1167380 [Cryptomeria japonica]|uniref:uncharacterized protein LOC131068417 n=1 Tax=Cryptomeria japonica TaxID=3369 RepID=UPI0024149216|nr:uncharacterized protein LOC131068417 [Cryptomeria japonica]GLJ54369.1 hypothetical protein SUGI_1167380 [Cryptomeria japonica]